jgi:vacuolar-type H+-ATPase subunit C/Vma6
MTNQTIEQLEQKILSGGSVSAAEMADAMRNSDAEKRINQLEKERELETAKTKLAEITELRKEAARGDLSPFELLSVANAIESWETKNIK